MKSPFPSGILKFWSKLKPNKMFQEKKKIFILEYQYQWGLLNASFPTLWLTDLFNTNLLLILAVVLANGPVPSFNIFRDFATRHL